MKTMKTITSKLSPPTDKCRLEITYQRRDGTQIKYLCGGIITEHARARECGGCLFCIGEINLTNSTNPKRIRSYGSSSPTFYRWPCEPCPTCKPKLERLDEIDHLIYELNKEKDSLL